MAEELLALRLDDIDFKASAGRVDEALDRKGVIGPCKNAAAYRTVWLLDAAGKKAMPGIKRFLAKNNAPSDALVFVPGAASQSKCPPYCGSACIQQPRPLVSPRLVCVLFAVAAIDGGIPMVYHLRCFASRWVIPTQE
jgi:hypothetical protein